MILFLWTCFGISMAFFEAAVVVYLRALYYPYGFEFPLVTMPPDILVVELGREMASLLMLFSVAWSSGRRLPQRWGGFLYLFGLWDLGYYLFLYLFLHWPPTLLTWDILFLIPIPWVAPVLAPMLAALSLVVMGLSLYLTDVKGIPWEIGSTDYMIGLVASCPILISFFSESREVIFDGIPKNYPWGWFFMGFAIAWIYFIYRIRKVYRLWST